MAVLLASLAVPLTWRELLARTVKEALGDNIFGMAAQRRTGSGSATALSSPRRSG